MRAQWGWVREVGPIAGLVALVVVHFWVLVTPFAASRLYLGGDFGLAVEPYFYDQLKRGILPVWDPTLGTGSPFLGGGTHHPRHLQAHLHLFYPLNVLILGLAERGQHISHLVLQYHHLLHYALAGVFTYAYARQLGLGRFAGSLSGIAFMFSGFMLAHVTHWTMIDTIVWLPAVLACLVRADATLRPRWGALGGLALGMAFLAGHPQLFYHVALVTVALGLTLVARRAAAAGPWRRLALILLLVPLVALGVAAVQLVPSWEVATASHRAQLGYDWKTNYSLLPADLLQALLPGGLRPAGESRSVSSELNAYPGVLPLILAIHVLARPWDWRAGFHAAVGFVAVLLAFGSHHGLYHTAYDFLPGFTLFRIPARFVGVAGFTVAVLAGLGAEALLTGPRPHRLARTLRRLTLVAVAGGVPLALVLVWARTLPNALDFRFFASQYVMLALFLAGTALVVTWPGRAQPRARRAALLTVLLADLMFGAPPVTGSLQSPDIPPPPEREWLEAIRRTPEPLRLARLDHIQPQMLYRHGWGVVDGQSTFAPSAFLDLYVLAREHPPLLDLLNVRYVVGDHTAAALLTARPAGALGLREGAVRRFPLPPGAAPRELEIQSHVVHGLELPQGGVVATIHLVTADGGGHVLPIRAGIETAEWALDRPGIQARHRKAPTARSWPVPEGHLGHSYRATFRLPRGSVVSEVVLQGGRGPVVLVVERLTADAVALWPIPPDRGRMRQVTAGLYENTRALPRAFLVRHARSVPSAQLADHLRDLDPREEVLVDGPVPPGWSSRPRVGATPLPRVEIATYRPDHVVLETTTPEPAVLVLSDTFQRGWSAWDNGQRVPVIRADHALRAVFLAPGRHRVEFRYRQPSVYIGVGVTLATLAGLGVAGILAARHRRAPAP